MGDAKRPEVRAATSPALLARECVNIIGLERFKDNAGPRWEKLRETIYARTEALLAQKLGSSDFFVRLNETAYLVTMPSSEKEDARICCLRVAHELHTSLLGSCNVQDIKLYRAADDGNGSFNLAQIIEPELGALARHAGIKELLPAGDGAKNVIEIHAALTNNSLTFTHGFLPIWDARKEAITGHRILSRRDTGIAKTANGPGTPREELGRVLASIAYTAEMLARHLEMGERFLMIVPTSYEVLASPAGRMEIASLCRNLSSELRPFLIFEVCDVPAGVPQSRLNEIITIVKPFCKAVMAEIPMRARNYAAYQGVGLSCFGLILPRHGMTGGEMRDEITKLCEAGKRMNLMTFLGNVASLDIASFARQAGINLMGGAAIQLPSRTPTPMRRLSAAELFRASAYTLV